MNRITLTSLILLFLCSPLYSQAKKNHLSIEGLGRYFLYGGLSYERFINPWFRAGLGLGIQKINTGDTVHPTYGSGSYLSMQFSTPVYLAFTLGSGLNRWINEIGMTTHWKIYKSDYQLINNSDLTVHLLPYYATGIEYLNQNFSFSVKAYILYDVFSDENTLLPVIPWIGVSLGRPF